MKTQLLILYAILTQIILVYAEQEYKFELVKKIPNGITEGALMYADQLSPSQGPSTFCISKEGSFYIVDTLSKRISIFNSNLDFIKNIAIPKVPIDDQNKYYYPNKIEVTEKSDIVLFDPQLGILRLKGNGITDYFIPNRKICKNSSTSDFIILDNLLLIYCEDSVFWLIENNEGKILYKNESDQALNALRGMNVGFVEINHPLYNKFIDFVSSNGIIYYNGVVKNTDSYYFSKYLGFCRENYKQLKITIENIYNGNMASYYFSGIDAHGNYYWHKYYNDLIVLSKYGQLLTKIIDDRFFLSAVNNNGDIFFYDYNQSGHYFYRIKNTWDPIKAGASSQSPADKPAPATSGTAAKVSSLTASSFIDYQAMYTPAKVFDSDPKTVWLEAAESSGFNEKITLTLDKDITVDEIRFMPGYFDPKWWKTNNRIKKLAVLAGDKAFSVDFADEMKEQTKKLDAPLTFTSITFSIKDIYRSTGDDDTALSEVAFYFKGKKIELDLSGVKL